MTDPRETSVPELLKKATIKLILERGYAGATLTPILKEAGLSKGALFHHFDGRDALIAAAYVDELAKIMALETAATRALRQGEIDLDRFLLDLVNRYCNDRFAVTMEVALAIRTRPQITEAAGGFADWIAFRKTIWSDTFDLPGETQARADIHWTMLEYTLRGLGLRRTFGTDDTPIPVLRAALHEEFFAKATIRPWAD